MITTIKIVGNKQGIYINSVNCESHIDICKCTNYNSVNFEGVNNVVVYRGNSGEMWIAQAGGYTYDRGLFVDLYTKEGVKYDY